MHAWDIPLTSSFPPSFSCLQVSRLPQWCQHDSSWECPLRLVSDQRRQKPPWLLYLRTQLGLLRHLLKVIKNLICVIAMSDGDRWLIDFGQLSSAKSHLKFIVSRSYLDAEFGTKIVKLRSDFKNKILS